MDFGVDFFCGFFLARNSTKNSRTKNQRFSRKLFDQYPLKEKSALRAYAEGKANLPPTSGCGEPAPCPHFDSWILVIDTISARLFGFIQAKLRSGFLKRALAQTCLRAWNQVRFFRNIFGHFLGALGRARWRPWYGTSAQPESHFTCSSPRGAPRVVPSTSLFPEGLRHTN